MNPYAAGVLLGIVLIAAFYIEGRGLGVSGAFGTCIAYFNSTFVQLPIHPLKSWIVWQVLGLLAGAFISGMASRRFKLSIDGSPKISRNRRLLFVTLGGLLFGWGAQMGRGCTSGTALSGMAVLSVAGFVTMLAIFGTGFALAWFVRKNWI